MSNQSGVQQAIRDSTGTTGTWSEDWSALFDADAVPAGTWDERLLAWINGKLSSSYDNLPGAMQAFAVDQGFDNWSSMNTITVGPGGANDVLLIANATDGLLLADGSSFLILAG